jgi:thioredoxin-like negative regulator of GroEL
MGWAGAALLLLVAGCPQSAAPPSAAVAPTPAPPSPAPPAPAGDQIHWYTSFAEAQAAARAAHKPMVVDFFATWCGPCKMLAETSFPTVPVQALKDRFVWARIDVDQNNALAQKYGANALPTVMVMDAAGKPFTNMVGYTDGNSLAAFLADGLAKSRLLKPQAPSQ